MKMIRGDAIVIAKNCGGILGHQVNCLGVANAGIAGQIRKRWPEWFSAYKVRTRFLGHAALQLVQEEPERLWIADLYGQYAIGQGRQTDYNALKSAITTMLLKRKATCPDATIFIPHGIGCGLAGGDWSIVYHQILVPLVPDAIIVKLPD